jgi:hypothetical protein
LDKVTNGLKCYHIELDAAYNNQIRFDSGTELFIDVNLNHEEKVTLKGKVMYAPFKNDLGIIEGDNVWVRYDLVADSTLFSTGARQHHNLAIIDGKLQWFATKDMIIAVERDGKFKVVPGLLMCKEIEEAVELGNSLIEIPEQFATNKSDCRFEVVDVNNSPNGIQVGDVIIADSRYVARYNFEGIYGHEVAVTKESRVIAKLEKDPA